MVDLIEEIAEDSGLILGKEFHSHGNQKRNGLWLNDLEEDSL